MFSLLFEFQPPGDQWDLYLADEKDRRQDLEHVQGLLENIRYRSLTKEGWILSLSDWSDEPSVVGWHARMSSREAKDTARSQILGDYRLRVGEVTSDTQVVEDRTIADRRSDASKAGTSTYVTLINSMQTPQWVKSNTPQEIALSLGFDLNSYGNCISWDVFEAVFNPGEIILVVTWKDFQSANDHAATQMVPDDARVRVLRVARDYSMSGEAVHLGSGESGREEARA